MEEVETVLFRHGGMAGPETRLAVRRFAERCRSEQELETLLGVARAPVERPRYAFREPRTPLDAVSQGEELARRERARLGLGEEPVRNPLELMERQGVRVGPLEGIGGEELDGVYFETRGLGPCIGVNLRRDRWTGFRTAFTAAHEYAHWLLNDTRAEPVRHDRFTTDLGEVRANAFAAALLMPREGIHRYFSAAGLIGPDGRIHRLGPADVVRAMDYFGVSRLALLNRLRSVALLPQPLWAELRARQFSVTDMAGALRLSLRTEYNLDAHLHHLVLRAWERGLLTTGRAADLLGMDLDEFRETMAALGVTPGSEAPPEVVLGSVAALPE